MEQPIHGGRPTLPLRECFVRLDRAEVDIHKLGGNRKRVYFCHVCTKTLYSGPQLKAHFSAHPGKKPFQCEYCEAGFVNPDVKSRHVIENHCSDIAKQYQCQQCYKSFALSRSLAVHSKTHVQWQKYSKECPICQVRTLELGRHLLTHTREKLHKCKYCDKTFTRSKSCRRHELDVHGKVKYKCSTCEKELSSSSAKFEHERLHQDKKFVCEFCAKSFYRRHHLYRHFQTHTGEKPAKCEHCESRFSDIGYAKAHAQRVHGQKSAEQPSRCRFCEKMLKNPEYRRRHENHKHKRIGFKCKYCNRLCQSPATRTAHEKCHTGEKNFGCGYCSNVYRTKYGLDLHTASAHTGEKPYWCNECELAFSRPQMLKCHQRSHTGEKSTTR